MRRIVVAISIAAVALAGCGSGEPDGFKDTASSPLGEFTSGAHATAAAAEVMTWGPFTACPDLSAIGFANGTINDAPRPNALRCNYDGSPAVIVEYFPDGYDARREEVFKFDYSQGGGAEKWPSFGDGAFRSFAGDDSFGACSFFLPSSPGQAYVVVSAVLDPGKKSYCEVASKAVSELAGVLQ